MGSRIGFVAAIVLGTLLSGSASMVGAQQKASAAPGAAIAKDARLSPTELAKIVEAYGLLIYSAPVPCHDADCSAQINFTFVTVGDQSICIAQVPESLVFDPGNTPRRITWTLNPAGAPPGAVVQFPMKHGILVVYDANGQIKPDAMQTNPLTYGATNKHKKETATYVPVILYTPAGAAPGVCATGDPKIVNN
jgi:hypothetical protein